MRILYFLAYSNGIGGAAKQMLAHASMMNNQKHTIEVILHNDRHGMHGKEYDTMCTALNLPFDSCVFDVSQCIEEINLQNLDTDETSIRNIIETFRPDIVHSLQINVLVEKLTREYKIPHVVSVYQLCEGMFNLTWSNILFKYHCADSEYYCNKWEKGLGIYSECIRVAYNCECTDRISSDKNTLELINIGVLCKHKRQLEVLRFINMCIESGIRVHITFLGNCNSDYGDECRKYIEENNLNEYVDIIGEVLNVEKYLLNSNLLIHASVSESYPGVIVEAMANKVPVLCTPVAGIPELVKSGVNGILSDGYEAQDLFDAFKEYLKIQESGDINNLIREAYRTYEECHAYKVISEKISDYYTYIIEDYKKYDHSTDIQEFNNVINQIKKFSVDKCVSKYSDYTQRHAWYLYHLNKICKPNSNAIVWGTGQMGSYGSEWCEILNLNILAYADNNREGKYMGYDIKKPEDKVLKSADYIFVSIGNTDYLREIIPKLEVMGRKRNVDYFLIQNNPCL